RLVPYYLTSPRLAPYCSSLHTGASFCLPHPPWQCWVPSSLRALPPSPLTMGFTRTCLLALRLGHAPLHSSLQVQLTSAPYSIQLWRFRLWAGLILFPPFRQLLGSTLGLHLLPL